MADFITQFPANEVVSRENFNSRISLANTAMANIKGSIDNHKADNKNPHKTTLAQVGGSRDNMARNWDLTNPANQRGITTLTVTAPLQYGLDCWSSYNCTIKVNSGNSTNIRFLSTADHKRFVQMHESQEVLKAGVTYTLTIFARCNIVSGTVGLRPCDSSYSGAEQIDLAASSDYIPYFFTFTPSSDVHGYGIEILAQNTVNDYADIDIKYWKLEPGTAQTLMRLNENNQWVLNDPSPNPQQVLDECQRYHQVLKGFYAPGAAELIDGVDVLMFGINLPVPMRITPSFPPTNINVQIAGAGGDNYYTNLPVSFKWGSNTRLSLVAVNPDISKYPRSRPITARIDTDLHFYAELQ
ncbi:MAG: hypothetical protein VB035_10155 [Candidatus Fimivivens sp.]|nr:hypothetical protein [Candidatus Fimivivens sp.]